MANLSCQSRLKPLLGLASSICQLICMPASLAYPCSLSLFISLPLSTSLSFSLSFSFHGKAEHFSNIIDSWTYLKERSLPLSGSITAQLSSRPSFISFWPLSRCTLVPCLDNLWQVNTTATWVQLQRGWLLPLNASMCCQAQLNLKCWDHGKIRTVAPLSTCNLPLTRLELHMHA